VRAIRLALVALMLLYATSPSRADQATCRFTAAELSADLDELEHAIAERWAWRELRRFDVAAAIRAVRDELTPATDGATFRALLAHLVAGMQDGHGAARVPCVSQPPLRRWPFTLVDTTDGIIIDDPDASAREIERGDRLLAIDDVPIERLIADAERSTAASTPGARRANALRWLGYTPTLGVAARILRDGKARTVSLSTKRSIYRQTRETIEWRALGDGVGYVRIGSLLPDDLLPIWNETLQPGESERLLAPTFQRIDAAFDAVADSRALVLDLRGNLGGSDLIGKRVANHLFTGGYVYDAWSARLPSGTWERPSETWLPNAKVTPFTGRVVVLVDELTMSAADNLSRCLRDLRHDLAFVGRPTGGSTGSPRDVTLTHSGAIVSFATLRVYGPMGKAIEGNPVLPDVPTAPRREDVLHRVDVDLAAALDALHWRPGR
jgi:C-terminal processing protease CtpA/Prc